MPVMHGVNGRAAEPGPQAIALKQAGLSLVELMIAVGLGLIITLGVVNLYLSSQDSYVQTEGLAHAQESARFVDAILGPEIMVAGQMGCVSNNSNNVPGVPPNEPTVDVKLTNPGPVAPGGVGLTGWEAGGTGPGDSITLDPTPVVPSGSADWSDGAGTAFPAMLTGNVVADTDVLVLTGAQSTGVTLDSTNPQNGNTLNLANPAPNIPAGAAILATNDNCSQGELFLRANNGNASAIALAGNGNQPASSLDLNYGPQSRVYQFFSTAYYIGLEAGGSGEPALFRQPIVPAGPAQALISGVESLQLMYGRDTDGDAEVDDYVTAAGVTNWAQVISMRFAILTRSQDNALEEPDDRSFNLLGLQITPPANAGNRDRRVRLQSTNTTVIRHRML